MSPLIQRILNSTPSLLDVDASDALSSIFSKFAAGEWVIFTSSVFGLDRIEELAEVCIDRLFLIESSSVFIPSSAPFHIVYYSTESTTYWVLLYSNGSVILTRRIVDDLTSYSLILGIERKLVEALDLTTTKLVLFEN